MAEKAQERLALDANPANRSIDKDGHLHIQESNISKACVNPYYGWEIPEFQQLGLQRDTRYQLLRDPLELERGAATFDGKPLQMKHRAQTAEDHDRYVTVGAISNPRWVAPYLKSSIAVWDGEAIGGIDTGEQKELSSSYRYKAVMEPGVFDGIQYDGRMTQIEGNHVALVPSGRAGSDVIVGDAALPPDTKEITMAKTAELSRTALYAVGALRAYLRPKLAADQKLDLTPILAGVTRKSWKTDRPRVKLAMDAAVAGKLGKDASLSDVDELLDEVQAAINDLADEPAAEAEDKTAKDEEAETDEEKAERMKKRAADKAAKDAKAKDGDPDKDKDKDKDKVVSKPAMDAAIAAAVRQARTETEAAVVARMRSIDEAMRAVRPHVGELVIAQDSAEDVYKLALVARGVDLTGATPESYAAMVRMLPKAADPAHPGMAADSAATSGLEAQFRKDFPDAVKVRRS